MSERKLIDPSVELEGLPRLNEKTSDGPGRLPIGLWEPKEGKFYRGYEIKWMSAEALTSFDDDSNIFKVFGALVARGLIRVFDLDSGEEMPEWKMRTSKIFYPDIFFLLMEIIIKTKGSSLISTAYKCPQCRKFTKFENPIGESGAVDFEAGFDLLAKEDEISSLEMEDLRSIKFNPIDLDSPEFTVKMKRGINLSGAVYDEFTFRIPEIGDYILKGGGNKKPKQVEKEVLFSCLVGLNDARGKELNAIKGVFGISVMDLPLDDYMKIVNYLNSIGYAYNDHKVMCAHCKYEFSTVFDLTNFFASILTHK